MFDRIICVWVRIRVRGHFVMSIVKSMHLVSLHSWTPLVVIVIVVVVSVADAAITIVIYV